VDLDTALVQFLDHRRLANCAPGTLRLYRRQLDVWRGWLTAEARPAAIPDLTIAELRDFAAYLRDVYVPYSDARSTRRPLTARGLSENTLASYHRTLRAFWSFLAVEGRLSQEQARFFARITAPSVPEDPRPSVDEPTIKRLLVACGDGGAEESARNRAIISLLSETGMRISELCNLTDRVVEPQKRRARVLRAKGGKHRMVFWQPSGAAALARYLLLRRGKTGGDMPLFRGCSVRNNGGSVTPDLVRATLKRIAAEARIVLPKGAPLHAIRHGFAHAALDAGAQITDLADLLGHADLETTRIYLRNDDDRLERAYQRIFSRAHSRSNQRPDAESHG
jgi:integrase/recombinase XerC